MPGSVSSRPGFSRTSRSSSAAELPRPWATNASTRTLAGASLSWRTSQFTRVVGRPSRGASTSTWQVTRPARRSTVMTRGPTVSGIRTVPVMCPCETSDAIRAWLRSAGSAASLRDSSGVTSVPRRRPSRRLVKVMSASKRVATSPTPLSVARSVPAATASRVGTQFSPMTRAPRQMSRGSRQAGVSGGGGIRHRGTGTSERGASRRVATYPCRDSSRFPPPPERRKPRC